MLPGRTICSWSRATRIRLIMAGVADLGTYWITVLTVMRPCAFRQAMNSVCIPGCSSRRPFLSTVVRVPLVLYILHNR